MLFFSVSIYFHSLPSVWNRAHDDDVKEQIKEAEVVKGRRYEEFEDIAEGE